MILCQEDCEGCLWGGDAVAARCALSITPVFRSLLMCGRVGAHATTLPLQPRSCHGVHFCFCLTACGAQSIAHVPCAFCMSAGAGICAVVGLLPGAAGAALQVKCTPLRHCARRCSLYTQLTRCKVDAHCHARVSQHSGQIDAIGCRHANAWLRSHAAPHVTQPVAAGRTL
jgi:hypothetical protein